MRAPFTQLYIHCVWATWDRQPLILPKYEARLYAAVADKCHELKGEAITVGGDLDHLHLLARLPVTVSVAELVKHVKGSTSHLMNHEIAPQREFKWQGYYGAFTVSPRAIDKIAAYVRGQKTHHAQRRTFPEWEQCYREVDDE